MCFLLEYLCPADMFYTTCLTFRAYLSPTSVVEFCKVHPLSTGFLDQTACLPIRARPKHPENGNLHRMRCTFMNLLHSICLAKTVQFLSALTIPIWLFPSWCIGDFLTSRHALQGAASLKGSTVFIIHNLIVCGNIAFDDTRGVAYTISMTLQLSNATKTTFISESRISQTSFSEKAPFS